MNKIKRDRAEELARNTFCVEIQGNELLVRKKFYDNSTKAEYKKGDRLQIVDSKKKEE